MRARQFIYDPDIEEGWRDVAVGLGTAAAGIGSMYAPHHEPSQPVAQVKQITPQKAPDIRQQYDDPKIDKSIAQYAHPSPHVPKTAEEHKEFLTKHATSAGISGAELQHFVSQMAHETRNFTSMVERGTPEYFTKRYEKDKRKAKVLGNTMKGDGERYKGRGYIQLTGRDNYTRAGRAIGVDLANNPDLAARPDIAAKVAEWYWKSRVATKVKDFSKATVKQVTKSINPNMAGLKHRQTQMTKMQSPR
jgi:predicted chitinase